MTRLRRHGNRVPAYRAARSEAMKRVWRERKARRAAEQARDRDDSRTSRLTEDGEARNVDPRTNEERSSSGD